MRDRSVRNQLESLYLEQVDHNFYESNESGIVVNVFRSSPLAYCNHLRYLEKRKCGIYVTMIW
jgi:hypothetical protein